MTTADEEKKPPLSDDEVRQCVVDLAKFMQEHEIRDLERALWVDVALKAREDLERRAKTGPVVEERDAQYFADWQLHTNAAARREWQRHLAALTIANGIMCGGSGTVEERLKMATAQRDQLTEFAYAMAETFMQHRERLAKVEATEGRGKEGPPEPEPGTKTVHILKHGWALCRTVDGIPREWPSGHRWIDSEAWELSNCVGCLVAHGRRLVDDHKEVKDGG